MVKITEPMTMLTDYLITVVTIWLSILMFQTTQGNLAVDLMAFSYIITGIGAFLGGTSHGFKQNFSEDTNSFIWKATTYSVGVAAVFLYLSIVLSSLEPHLFRSSLLVLALIQTVLYLVWMYSHSEFLYVIVNYAIFMVLALSLKIYSFFRFDDPSSVWIISGIVVTFIASGIQASEITIHPKYFNHNDLFHVVQLPGFYLVFKGILISTMM